MYKRQVEDVSAATPSSVGDMWLPITLNSWVTSDATGKLVGNVGTVSYTHLNKIPVHF